MEMRVTERTEFNRPLEFELSVTESSATGRARCKAQGLDISSRGLGLLTEYPLVKGMVVRLVLRADGVAVAVPVFAEVAWTDPVSDRLRAGFRFLG